MLYHVRDRESIEEIVSIYVVFPVGAMQDPLGKSGLAHLLEHLMFKRPDSMTQLEAMGKWNATTTHEATMFYVQTTLENCENATKLMFEMCSSLPVITEADLANEIKIIMHEDGSYPFTYSHVPVVDEVFLKGTSYDRSIIGNLHSLNHITLQDIHDFYQAYYQVGFFVTVGPRAALARIRHLLKSNVYAQRISQKPMVGKPVPFAEAMSEELQKGQSKKKNKYTKNKKMKKSVKIFNMITKTPGATLFSIGFKIDVPFSFKSYVALSLVAYTIRCELYNVIREQMHATYTPSCKLRIFKGFYVMSITIVCHKRTLVECIDVAMKTVAQIDTLHVKYKTGFVTMFNMNIEHNLALLRHAPSETCERLDAAGSRIRVKPLLHHFKKKTHWCLMLAGNKPSLMRMRKSIPHF